MGIMASLASLTGCNAQTSYPRVDEKEFEELIRDEKVVRLDVRSPEEYVEGHIAQTLNIDVRQEEFESRVLKSLPKDRTIAVYCRSGNRSRKACEILTRNGYKIVELARGIMGWESAGKPVTKEEVDVFTTAGGTPVSLLCIKHGTLRIQVGDKYIYVDPVIQGAQPVTDFSAMPKADYILVTHEHGDHLDTKAIGQLTKEGTLLVANPRSNDRIEQDASQMAHYAQLAKKVMSNGDQGTLGSWSIDAVPAYNNSADKQQFHPKGRDNGYVLTIDGLRIYIAGDTEDIPEMEALKDIDIAFLPCNLPYTMTPEQAARAARTLTPADGKKLVLFPYHYGKTDIQQLQRLLDDSPVDVRIRQYQ